MNSWFRQAVSPGLQRLLRFRLARVVVRAVEQYDKDGCVYMAAALSFYAMISLIPLTFIGFSILSAFVGSSSDAQREIEGLVRTYLLPGVASDMMARIRSLADAGIFSALRSWWGALAFVWSGISFYEYLQSTLTRAWGGQSQRPFLHRKLLTLIAFLTAGLLLAMTLFLTAATATLESLSIEVFGDRISFVWVLVARALPFLLAILVFFLIYKFMPRAYVPWRLAVTASVPAAVFWEFGKRVFTHYVTQSHRYTTLFGPMASLIVLMVWIYYSSSLVLFGAEMGAAWQGDVQQAEKETPNDGAE